MKFFALQMIGKVSFGCVSKTRLGLDKKVRQAYYNQKGMAPKGTEYPMEEFMKTRRKVIVTVEAI